MSINKYLKINARTTLVDWIYQVNKELQKPIHVFVKAINYMDQYFEKKLN